MLNFFYTELIEIVLLVYIWKGVWDFIDNSLNDVLANVPNSQVINFSLSALIGYGTFFTLIYMQKLAPIKQPIIAELCHVMAFFSIVALWHTFQDGSEQMFFFLIYFKLFGKLKKNDTHSNLL